MSDFRGPLPLDERDFAEVRRNVMKKLERRPIAPIVFRFAIAAAAVIVLAIILFPRPQTPAKPPQAVHKAIPIVVPPAPPIEVAQTPPVKKPLPKPHRKPEHLVAASTGGPPPDSEVTINIQTADPNIRIVWIAQR